MSFARASGQCPYRNEYRAVSCTTLEWLAIITLGILGLAILLFGTMPPASGAEIAPTFQEIVRKAEDGRVTFVANGVDVPECKNQTFVRVDTTVIPKGLWCIYYDWRQEFSGSGSKVAATEQEIRDGYCGPKDYLVRSTPPPAPLATSSPLVTASVVNECTTGTCPYVRRK